MNLKLIAWLAVMLSALAQAQVERRDHAVSATGLEVAFPDGFGCERIASPYASSTRYDGSSRRGDRNGGLHGGIDLSLKVGTPLLAIADGEVITFGEGGRLEGIYLWLLHSPEDTGTPFHVFSKYQHLSALPALKTGDRVKAGAVVAHSGASGTVGRHYGVSGYAHLHLTTFYGPSAEYEVKGMFDSMVSGRDSRMDDPLVLYAQGLRDLAEVRQLPEPRRIVRPAVVGSDGAIHPPGGKTVWPVACKEPGAR